MGVAQIRKTFTLFPLAAMVAAGLYAQEYRGRIQGTVVDTSQAAVAGATVTLLNVKTGVPAVRQTNETGHYLFDLVDPGTYTVTIEFQGFSKFVQENVTLLLRSDLTVDATLKPGDVRETVTVTGEVAAVQFNSAKLETTYEINEELVGWLKSEALPEKVCA